MADNGKDVIIAMLSGTFRLTPFKNFGGICAMADTIVQLKARCLTCELKDAPFTVRLTKVAEDIDVSKIFSQNYIKRNFLELEKYFI